MTDDIPDAEDLSIPCSVDDATTEYVTKDELRALVGKWSNTVAAHPTQGAGIAKAKRECADELEELIEDE